MVLEIECENEHKVKWSSSKMINNMYSINLQLSAAITLSGNLFAKVSLLSNFLGLKIPSESSFYRVLRLYVTPSVNWWWEQMQEMLLEKFRGKQLYLAGDGRNDSPGHCSTYCNYTLMDTTSNLIIHQEVVDVRQAEMKSPNMEKIGCRKGLEFLKEKKLRIAGFVKDDHNQISAMMCKPFSLTLSDLYHLSLFLHLNILVSLFTYPWLFIVPMCDYTVLLLKQIYICQ